MIAAADRILDAAIQRLPSCLAHLPEEVRPSADELSQSLRRDYKINGLEVDVKVSVRSGSLPKAWLASLEQKEGDIPRAAVAVSKITGWLLGVDKKEQNQLLDKINKEVNTQKRNQMINQVSQGLSDLMGIAVELEVLDQSPKIVSSSSVRQVSIRRRM